MKFFKLFLIILLTAFFAVGCTNNDEVQDAQETPQAVNAIEIGQGETVFRFEMTDNENNITAWDVRTNEETVGAALTEVGLIDGIVGAFGLQVTMVNGITADYDTDQSWWMFLIDSEMAMTGVDSTEIKPDIIYSFVYTIG